ncbi:HipA domain-containing protein [Actinomadura meridiana]|uniref:HipA domain-containing protein n=1 Tax=Actinomadura meridiana TaxID=559626 RepID=A0ABP8CPU0_9ACTN
MSSPDKRFGVWLGERRVGTIVQQGDRTRFTLDAEYREDPQRPVLGLRFEQNLSAVHAATVRLPPWFSNLLPEGRLRDWIAADRRVSAQREMELLIQVGHDLPGAVRVFSEAVDPDDWWDGDSLPGSSQSGADDEPAAGWRFSLAGVALKFSVLRRNDRLTLPAYGEGGDWIMKLPDRIHRDVPRNEFAMMSLAAAIGIDVPEICLVHRSQIDDLPEEIWPDGEEVAYVIRRFDREGGRRLVHMEDLAQVRNLYPDKKYLGNFETVASLIYRRHDVEALREFTRRLAFCVLISNGDAHLKNWSLLYRDPRVPTLSPAYDLVSTAPYRTGEEPEDLGLKFGGTRHFHNVTLRTFSKLQDRLGAVGTDLPQCVAEVIERTRDEWPGCASHLNGNQRLQDAIDASIKARSRTLLRGAGSGSSRS